MAHSLALGRGPCKRRPRRRRSAVPNPSRSRARRPSTSSPCSLRPACRHPAGNARGPPRARCRPRC